MSLRVGLRVSPSRGLLSVHSGYGPKGCGPPMVDLCLASFDGSVTLAAVAIATGVDRQFPGQDFHLLDPYSFMTHTTFGTPVHGTPPSYHDVATSGIA